MNKPVEQQLEEYRLKVEAYKEELGEKTEKVADLRVQLTMSVNRISYLEEENKELKRVAALAEEANTDASAGTEDSNDSN